MITVVVWARRAFSHQCVLPGMSVTGILVQEVVMRLTNIAVVGITEDKAWAPIVMVADCSESGQ
jgi:hypothetical protein